MKKIAVIISAGFEELEAITVIDLLRRSNIGVEVLGVGSTQLTGAHGITIACDDGFDYYSSLEYDGVVIVGGMNNAINLSQDDKVLALLKDYMSKGKMVAGICAAPALVFSVAGILDDKQATCYPSPSLIEQVGDGYLDSPCVVCDNLITSQSPDTALEFALTIIKYLGYDAGVVYSELQGK